ncbi:unnamed protein product [Closterium sp. NIES-54]
MFGSKPVDVSVDPAAGLAVVPSSVCKPEAGGGVGVVPGEPLEELLSFLADMSSFFMVLPVLTTPCCNPAAAAADSARLNGSQRSCFVVCLQSTLLGIVAMAAPTIAVAHRVAHARAAAAAAAAAAIRADAGAGVVAGAVAATATAEQKERPRGVTTRANADRRA